MAVMAKSFIVGSPLILAELVLSVTALKVY